jgi:hypothetical protein
MTYIHRFAARHRAATLLAGAILVLLAAIGPAAAHSSRFNGGSFAPGAAQAAHVNSALTADEDSDDQGSDEQGDEDSDDQGSDEQGDEDSDDQGDVSEDDQGDVSEDDQGDVSEDDQGDASDDQGADDQGSDSGDQQD